MKREQGLSEVIGFLMIIALLGMLFSMYLLYVVPLQGRDSEISHMDQVKEQFSGIIMDINALIVNEKLNYPLQREISLGSGQGGTSGAFSIFPVQSYSDSSGTLTVDTENPALGEITFTLNGTGVNSTPSKGPDNPDYVKSVIIDPHSIQIRPNYFYLNYHVADSSPVNESDIIKISSLTNWSAIVRVIDHYDQNYVNISNWTDFPGDLTITVKKGENTTIDNLTVVKYVEKNRSYPINLYDWTYGLADVIKDTYDVTYKVNDQEEEGPFPIGQVKYPEMVEKEIEMNHDFSTGGDDEIHPLSMFSFRSDNKYWINQEYQYQWGALFINQTDGTALSFLPPVNIKMNDDGIIHVDLTDTIIETHGKENPNVLISGNQVNPVIITLSNLSEEINGYKLLDGVANAKYLIITISGFSSDNEKDKWEKVFSRIADNAKKGDKINATHIAKKAFEKDDTVNLIITNSPEVVNVDNDFNEKIDKLDDVKDTLDTNINDNNLKISYKRANVSVSLYNIGQ